MNTDNVSNISTERIVANEFARQLRLQGYTGRVLEHALIAALKECNALIIPVYNVDNK